MLISEYMFMFNDCVDYLDEHLRGSIKDMDALAEVVCAYCCKSTGRWDALCEYHPTLTAVIGKVCANAEIKFPYIVDIALQELAEKYIGELEGAMKRDSI